MLIFYGNKLKYTFQCVTLVGNFCIVDIEINALNRSFLVNRLIKSISKIPILNCSEAYLLQVISYNCGDSLKLD